MAGNLPSGKWSAALIGAWWPQPPTALRTGAKQWQAQTTQQQHYAQDLRNTCMRLSSQNQGHTADDLISRYQQGEKQHLDLAEKYNVKADAFDKGADAINALRDGLKGIAREYGQKIEQIEHSKGGLGTFVAKSKLSAIKSLIAEANGFAAHKSGAAVSTLMDNVQKILTAEGVAMSPQQFLQSLGLSTDIQAPDPKQAAAQGLNLVGASHGGQGSSQAANAAANGGADVAANGGPPGAAPLVGTQHGSPVVPVGNAQDTGNLVGAAGASPAIPGVRGPANGGVGIGAPIGAPGAGRVPTVNSPLPSAGGLSPVAAVSPDSLGKSFTTGMTMGQPAAAGAHSLSAGTMNAVGSASAPPPQAPAVPVVSAPTTAGGVESVASEHGSGAPAPAASGAPAVSPGGGVPVAPAVVTGSPGGAPPAVPVAAGPTVPTGPLPAYGSDLRPPVVVPPAMAGSAAPVSGAPVVASPPSSPSAAGGAMVSSPVERAAGSAAGQSGAGSQAMAGASVGAATAGAGAGDVSRRAAEQQRLQRLVDAVARQAPELSWAVGLRDDDSTLLVSDIAGGWIPPVVKIPKGVKRLLEPAVRRRDAGVVDLLGAVTAAAVHQPNGYISASGPEDPALTGDREARAGPDVDELNPTLVDAVRRRDGLPRIAQTLAQAATRRTGVTENEIEELHNVLRSAYQKVLEDPRDLSRAADWMLLAAIEGLTEGHEYLAKYHVAWFKAISTGLR